MPQNQKFYFTNANKTTQATLILTPFYLGTLLLLATFAATLASAQTLNVGTYEIEKRQNYVQSGPSASAFDAVVPFTFESFIEPGVSRAALYGAAAALPSGSTGGIDFGRGLDGLGFSKSFISKTAMDAAFANGTYGFAIDTSAGTFSVSQNLTDNYPTPLPQLTNTNWSGGNLMVDPASDFTFTWSSLVFAGYYQYGVNFSIENTDVNASGGANSFVLPAHTLQPNTTYLGVLRFAGGGFSLPPLTSPPTTGQFYSEIEVKFIIQTGSLTPFINNVYLVKKSNVLWQTSNAAPVSTPNNPLSDNVPYSFSAQSPAAGLVRGRTVAFTLGYTLANLTSNGMGSFGFTSGPVATTALLDASFPNGNYTLPDGNVVSLSGNLYPNAPQVILVNGATPVWNKNGKLVLDPTIANTLGWIGFSTSTFATKGIEHFSLSSLAGGDVDIQQDAGVVAGGPAFNAITIPANTLTPGFTYKSRIAYLLASGINSPYTNGFDIAGYETKTDFAAVGATPAQLYFQNGTALGSMNLHTSFLPGVFQTIGDMNTGWQERAIADVNQDGIPDILFQNGTALGALIMNANGTPRSWTGTGSLPAGWELRGTIPITVGGSLTTQNLICQNSTQLGYFSLNTSYTLGSLNVIGAMGAGWELRATADLNGDGAPELLFQNGTLLGALQLSGSLLPSAWHGIGSMGAGFTLSYAVDVDGDGQPELIFQNGTTLGALQVNTSFQPTAWHGAGTVASGWTLPGDY